MHQEEHKRKGFSDLPHTVQILVGFCLLAAIAATALAVLYAGDFVLLAVNPLRKLFFAR